SEVSLALETEKLLEKDGIKCRVVSMPSWELFEAQSETYKKEVLSPSVKARVVIEAGISQGWCRYAGEKGRIVSQDSFGASAPYKDLREKFGFTAERVIKETKASIKEAKE
ncbi:MAG: transketolase, partial [Spirochaetota bacterium]